MYTIAIPYFTGNGHTQKLAQAIAKGMRSNDQVNCHVINIEKISETEWELLHSADGIIFGSPTYMGTIAATFKKFMENTSSFWVEQKWQDKLAAGFTVGSCPSGDKLNTLTALVGFAAEHGMIWVGQNQVGSRFTGDGNQINHDGSWLGLMATSHRDKSELIHEYDTYSAELFGERFVEAVLRWE